MLSRAQESTLSASEVIFRDEQGHVVVTKTSGTFVREREGKQNKTYLLVKKKISANKYRNPTLFKQYVSDECEHTRTRLGYCAVRFEDDQTAILTMPLIEGETLAALVKKQLEKNECIDDAKACLMVSTLLQELRKLQKITLVHGDLKPSNIMIKLDGKSKIFDFGDAHKKDSAVDQIDWKHKRTLPHISPVCFFRSSVEDEVAEPSERKYIADYSQDLYSLRYVFQEILAIVEEDSLFFKQLVEWIDYVDEFATKQMLRERTVNAENYFERIERECSQMAEIFEKPPSQSASFH